MTTATTAAIALVDRGASEVRIWLADASGPIPAERRSVDGIKSGVAAVTAWDRLFEGRQA